MSIRARDVMQATPISLPSDMPFLDVQHLFVAAQIGGAPVVAKDGVIVGMVSAVDLLRAVDQACDQDVDPERAADSQDPTRWGEDLRPLTATDVATPDPVWVTPDTSVEEVAALMRREGVHRVLVGRDGALEGIVTAFDLLQAVRS